MGSTTFTLLGVSYYLASVIIIIIVLNKINKKDRNKYLKVINELEKNKNLIISSGILTELNNANNLVNNKEMQEMYDDWKKRFNYIKEVEIPKITDSLIEIQDLFDNKKYKDLNKLLAKTELNIDYVKTKSNYLLNEIKKVTTSSSRSREEILKLKQKYREIITKYNNNKSDYSIINGPIELQFENVDKLFSHFEVAIDENNYQETSKVLNALNDIVGNLDLIIKESPSIILLGTKLLPSKMQDVYVEADKSRKDGYNLDYLNIEYNYDEANKQISTYLKETIAGLEARDYVERYTWFNFDDDDVNGGKTALYDQQTGQLTDLGKLYKSLGNPNIEGIDLNDEYVEDAGYYIDLDKMISKADELIASSDYDQYINVETFENILNQAKAIDRNLGSSSQFIIDDLYKQLLEAYNGLEKQTVTPELPKEDKVTKQTELSSSSSVATGDTSNVLMLMLLMLISYSGFKLVNK